ncbi:hypothetical protein ACWDZ4_22030 [Streptomyces sp. NPDC003016]
MSQRTGITKFVGNVLDEAKDLADDVLERARDLEHDLRNAVSRCVKPVDDAPRPAAPVPSDVHLHAHGDAGAAGHAAADAAAPTERTTA